MSTEGFVLVDAKESAADAHSTAESTGTAPTALPAADLLQQLDLYDAACNGNASILLALQEAGLLASIAGINQLHAFQPQSTGGTGQKEKPALQDTTALYMACARGHTEVVRLLLTVPGVAVNWRDKAGYTALMAACRWQQSDAVIALLADPRTDANVKDLQDGFNAMMLASGDMRILQALLADGRCDPNVREKCGFSTLCMLATGGSTAMVALLLADRRVNVNTRNSHGYSPLMWAAYEGHDEVIHLLLKAPELDCNAKNEKGQTALMLACSRKHPAAVQALLADARVQVNLADKNGMRALDLATNEEIKRLLKAKGARQSWWNGGDDDCVVS